jgi:hypothetical protein
MQATGDIGWRDDDAVGVAITLGREIASLLPGLVPVIFQLLRLVGFVHECFGFIVWEKRRKYT